MQQPNKEEYLAVYDAHGDAVFRRCLFKTSDREVARDLTQEAFTRTWEYLQDGKEIDHMKGFVFRVANNLIKDHYKKKSATPMGKMENFDPQRIVDSLENITAKSEVNQLLRELEDMKSADRDVLTLHIVEGFGPKTIAKIKDARENTIAVRLHRARRRLREKLDIPNNDTE
jgi:RNA polymerase sigma-70 factor (ECF subfamily)